MKTIVTIATLALLFVFNTLEAQNKTITVSIENVTSDEGKVGFALYTKDNFMGKPVQGTEGKIKDGKTTVVFENVTPGEYAIICYHDKNNNNKLDFAANRMPLEDFGASNNNMSFGPPQFEDAKFAVSDKNVSLEIKF